MAAPGWISHDDHALGGAGVDSVTRVLSWSDGAASETLSQPAK